MEERLLALLRLAVKAKATDIHFTLRGSDVVIEMRVDDQLRRVKSAFQDEKLIRYLQYLANLDVGNILAPQTGQFEMEVDGVTLSLRFAVINHYRFTNAVLRILNSSLRIDARHLSSLPDQNRILSEALKQPYGLILFSGPTGSGKTTAVYALLENIRDRKIFTIEDPIEVYNDSFIQLQVNEAMGFGYSDGIRQILRHDPDVIMVGEIRNEKAAKMAVTAANTGHLVLSTIHASAAPSVITRMSELGVAENHLYDVLICLVNQRMMIEKKTKQKRIYFEVMDRKEIEYYRQNHSTSPSFLTVEEQVSKGIRDGVLEA